MFYTKIIDFTDDLLTYVPGDYHDRIKKSIQDVLFRNLTMVNFEE